MPRISQLTDKNQEYYYLFLYAGQIDNTFEEIEFCVKDSVL